MRLVQQGATRAAFGMLMKQHADTVGRYCRVALGDSVLADDVLQQVFLEAYRDLPRFQPRASLRTWLLGIARHRVLDAARSRRREQTRAADDVTDAPATHPIAPSALDDLASKQALAMALERLPASTRHVVLLRFLGGLTFEEIATIVSERPDTVRVRVARALPLLRREIERLTKKSG